MKCNRNINNVVMRLIQREYATRGHLRRNLLIMRCLVCEVFCSYLQFVTNSGPCLLDVTSKQNSKI